jgi:hypothetical protein
MAKFDDFLPGMPDDLTQIPTLVYQVIEGRVFTLMKWANGSTARGETTLEALQRLHGAAPKAGWYSASGKYLGSDPGLVPDWPSKPTEKEPEL